MDVVYWTFQRPFRLRRDLSSRWSSSASSRSGSSSSPAALRAWYLLCRPTTAFGRFSSEGLVGATVALSMTRELGPVLTGLMVTGRAGSAMAAELGTMRVTEQIDALTVMALNPVKYLVVPRVVAALLMLPILTVIADFTGILGGYFVGVKLLGINEGVFMSRMVQVRRSRRYLQRACQGRRFGVILALISCYKGFYTQGRRGGRRQGHDRGGGCVERHDPHLRLRPHVVDVLRLWTDIAISVRRRPQELRRPEGARRDRPRGRAARPPSSSARAAAGRACS